MELEFEAVKRVKLGDEHRWTALVEGDEGFQWRKQNKKKELSREKHKLKITTEAGSNVDAFFCWHVRFFVIDSDFVLPAKRSPFLE